MRIDNDLLNLVTNSQMRSGNNFGTGMLIIHPITRKLLLGKRTDTKNWCSPGGKCELGESPLQGVLRETKEESNINVNSANFYDVALHTADNGKNWSSFMFFTDDYDDSEMTNQVSEVEPWGYYSLEEALSMDLFPPTRKSIERAIELGIIENKNECYNYIPFVDCPTSGFTSKDSCCCAYSYCEPEKIFTTHQLLPWD